MRNKDAGSCTVGAPTGWRSTLIVSCLVLLLAGCASVQSGQQSGKLEFALIGDMPYDGRQEKEFAHLMRDIDAADIAFVVHNGDFWYDGSAAAGAKMLEFCRFEIADRFYRTRYS
jgi:hypothetical protein